MDIPFLPLGGAFTLPSAPLLAPTPLLGTPKYQPEQLVYKDDSGIKGQPRLGVSVIHVPTCTTIYICAGGTKETHTIMRVELVAIYTALYKFATREWVGIFTCSLSRLQAIRHCYTHQGPSSAKNYHHHLLVFSRITDLLDERRRRGFRTTLHKIQAHTNIRGNDLADAAAKVAVKQYDSLSESQSTKVDFGEVPPRPPRWVMYNVMTPLPPTHVGSDTRMATLCQPWWLTPEEESLQLHAFTRPSQQLRRTVRHTPIHSLR
jgi:hypothetical protein